ncbi:2-oxoglutarate and iron-dependent oxygenase JMJD4 isoform X2 [Nilaparvata lugens]|uniref:2-oxoglutarate and iron-dependent oxygenase JMJD4 isoform X2 n=1 Tax=Nilaparvata lugens TaxID=108931 RepID=UPI00193CA211|nr:2-oxoglutarate and iron-dependent oxygenase JMJD4 isoform X2 [Nilaparvata lugens]
MEYTRSLTEFREHISKTGSFEVPVANCGSKYYNSQEKENMSMKSYIVYWKDYIANGYPEKSKILYLKDWHFNKADPSQCIYKVPNVFCSDWLNEYFTLNPALNDDYQFVYMGPKNSWTPFHADVFTSFSWSANVCGRKKWILFPPGEENCFKDKFGNVVYDIQCPDLTDPNLYPNYKNLKKSFEVIQNPGEAIFVPSGWYHQVWNLEDTISINHNWVNACNATTVWRALQTNLINVQNEISDCKDMDGWHEHCQIILRANFGMNYADFFNFLKFILDRRTEAIRQDENLVFNSYVFGKNHLLHDIRIVRNILNDMISDPDVKILNDCETMCIDEIIKLVNSINSLLVSNNNILDFKLKSTSS